MHLIKSLVSGIVGAENGTAVLYAHNTTDQVGFATTWEAAAVGTPQDVVLDQYGSAVVYVDVVVRVVVKTSAGITLRSFVDGQGDNNVEVRSASFTGTDYDTAAVAAGNPTTLRSVLDRWLTSAGAVDFNVLAGGEIVTLAAAAKAAYGVFYNVKGAAFGAVGDGVVDDRDAFVNAIAAASAAGGGVVFVPAGTYKTTAAISLPAKVSLLGAGAQATSILSNSSTADVFTINGSPTSMRSISGLTIGASVSSTGQALEIGSSEKLLVKDCVIGTNLTSFMVAIAAGGLPEVRIEGTRFNIGVSSAVAITTSTAAARAGRVDVVSCTFVLPASWNGAVYAIGGGNIFVRDCLFDARATTSGTGGSCIYWGGITTFGSVHGCEFLDPSSGTATITCMALGTLNATTQWFEEDGNMVSMASTCFTLYSYTHSADGYFVKLGTRETRYKEISTAVAGPTALGDLAQYGVIVVRSTFAGVMTYTTSPAGGPSGCATKLLIINGDASTRVITLGSGFKAGGPYSLLTNEAMGMEVVAMSPPAGAGWYLTGFSGADAGSDGYTI